MVLNYSGARTSKEKGLLHSSRVGSLLPPELFIGVCLVGVIDGDAGEEKLRRLTRSLTGLILEKKRKALRTLSRKQSICKFTR